MLESVSTTEGRVLAAMVRRLQNAIKHASGGGGAYADLLVELATMLNELQDLIEEVRRQGLSC
jgi:hypothetical protein